MLSFCTGDFFIGFLSLLSRPSCHYYSHNDDQEQEQSDPQIYTHAGSRSWISRISRIITDTYSIRVAVLVALRQDIIECGSISCSCLYQLLTHIQCDLLVALLTDSKSIFISVLSALLIDAEWIYDIEQFRISICFQETRTRLSRLILITILVCELINRSGEEPTDIESGQIDCCSRFLCEESHSILLQLFHLLCRVIRYR
jgi:hypothetical protein